jgi:GrpB-like predicted nucleotidyltransferase (UPF0157 family)
MAKRTLQDLSKEEIGQLFPVEICAYNDVWPKLYEEEKNLIIKTIDPGLFSRIEHFGSTSIPGLYAKDTIDMLMEVEFSESNNEKLVEQMKTLGYEFNWQNEGPNTHMVFVKGYNVDSPKDQTYHIHAGPKAHPIWDRLLFKDYLIKHPDVAKAYEELKIELVSKFRHDRVGYRVAKTGFISEITQKAKLEFQ